MKVALCTSRSSRWAVSELPSSGDLDPHPRTDAPGTPTPSSVMSHFTKGKSTVSVDAYPVVASLALGTLGAMILGVFFAGFKEQWPVNYTSITSEFDAHHRRDLPRFLLVRVSPTALTAGGVAIAGEALGALPYLAALFTGVAHVLVTDLRAIVKSGSTMPPARVAYHLGSTLVVLLGTFAGGVLGLRARWLFPSATEMRDALWTAVVVAILAGWYLKSTSRHPDSHARLRSVQRDVGSALWRKIPTLARQQGADPYLLWAIVAAEVTQRPRWVRRIERRVPWQGSYGVAQIKSDEKLTDTESVTILARNFSGVVPERYPHGNLKFQHRLENLLENHNSSRAFISDVMRYLEELPPRAIAQSDGTAPDGFPHLLVHELQRKGGTLALRGSWYGPQVSLTAFEKGSGDEVGTFEANVPFFDDGKLRVGRRAEIRRKWNATVPIHHDGVTLYADDARMTHKVDVDFSWQTIQ